MGSFSKALFKKDVDPDIVERFRVGDVDDKETPEPPWRVVLENDDVTPMEYVVSLLSQIFGLGAARATWIMVKAHVTGQAVVQEEPREDALAHVAAAHARARADGHLQLSFRAEPANG